MSAPYPKMSDDDVQAIKRELYYKSLNGSLMDKI